MADEKQDALAPSGPSELAGLVKAMLARPDLIEPSSGLPWGVLILSMTQSSYVTDKTLSDVIVKIVAGKEMGLKPFQSAQHVYLIPGTERRPAKVGVESIVRASKIKESGRYDYRVKESTAERCEIEFFEVRGEQREFIGSAKFTIEEARQAGLTNKGGPWDSYAEDMLFARAMSRGQRRFAPDVLGGLSTYTPDEMDEITQADQGPTIIEPSRPAVNPALEPFFTRLGWRDAEVQMWLGRHRSLSTDQMQTLLGKELGKAKAAATPPPAAPAPEPEIISPSAPAPEPPAGPPPATGPSQDILNF